MFEHGDTISSHKSKADNFKVSLNINNHGLAYTQAVLCSSKPESLANFSRLKFQKLTVKVISLSGPGEIKLTHFGTEDNCSDSHLCAMPQMYPFSGT